MTCIAYLDDFGHVGPYIDRARPKLNDSPVFGLAGIVLPLDEIRGLATWFFQRKRELPAFDISRTGEQGGAPVWLIEHHNDIARRRGPVRQGASPGHLSG